MSRSLAHRVRVPELMDDPALDPAEHRRALVGLARLNAAGGATRLLWPPLVTLARALGRPIRVLDVATGSGDVPVSLWAMAKRAGVPLELAGCDISETALAVAKERATAAGASIDFFRHDALATDLPTGFDAITCSLFLHHLDEPDVLTLLARMKAAAGRLVLVSDLARSRLNLLLVNVACRLLTRSKVVHYDGPVSIRAAFTLAEMRNLADRAGLAGATIEPRFPCRFVMAWRKV